MPIIRRAIRLGTTLLATAMLALHATPAGAQSETTPAPRPGLELRRAPAVADDDGRRTVDERRREARERDRLRRRAATDPRTARRSQAIDPGTADAVGDNPLTIDGGGFVVVVESETDEYIVAGDDADDPIRLFVTSEEDGFLTLLAGGTGPDLTVLAPNSLIVEIPVRAGETIEFPFPELQYQGVELYPRLPPGVAVSQQTIVAIVTRRPVPLPIDWLAGDDALVSGTVPVRLFQHWLSSIPLAERGVAQTLFVVRAP